MSEISQNFINLDQSPMLQIFCGLTYTSEKCWCKKRVVVQNKTNLLPKICWVLHEHYNYLQFTQIRNYLQKIFKVPTFALFDIG